MTNLPQTFRQYFCKKSCFIQTNAYSHTNARAHKHTHTYIHTPIDTHTIARTHVYTSQTHTHKQYNKTRIESPLL